MRKQSPCRSVDHASARTNAAFLHCEVATSLIACFCHSIVKPCRHREAIFLWRVNKLDFLVWLTAFIIVVFAGVEAGLASAVGLSLLIVLWKVCSSS